MQISAIGCNRPKPCFTSNRNGYENPINRKSEKNLAIWTNIGAGALVGATAAGVGSFFIKEGAKHRAWKLGGIGAAFALVYMALTLPSKIYNPNVNAFAREKEMDVFSRDRDLKSNIMEEVNKEVKDEDVSLDDKINHYTSVQMANNGNGLLIKGA
ncbi:hypothetical protein J6P92_07900 [bacterium]|nr:hypothetical protein [bacterium]